MPATTRVSVRASFVYFILGSALGALLLVNRWIPLWDGLFDLRDSHVVFVVDGWVTQLILGVGWWLLPPLHIGLKPGDSSWKRRGQTQRGSEPLFWAIIGLLNAGIVLRALCAPLYEWTGVRLFDVLAGIAPFLLLAAAVGFVAIMWGRVRELKRR
jgi:hypothetical protein